MTDQTRVPSSSSVDSMGSPGSQSSGAALLTQGRALVTPARQANDVAVRACSLAWSCSSAQRSESGGSLVTLLRAQLTTGNHMAKRDDSGRSDTGFCDAHGRRYLASAGCPMCVRPVAPAVLPEQAEAIEAAMIDSTPCPALAPKAQGKNQRSQGVNSKTTKRGGARAGAGRPSSGDRMVQRTIYLTSEVNELLDETAAANGETASAFIARLVRTR